MRKIKMESTFPSSCRRTSTHCLVPQLKKYQVSGTAHTLGSEWSGRLEGVLRAQCHLTKYPSGASWCAHRDCKYYIPVAPLSSKYKSKYKLHLNGILNPPLVQDKTFRQRFSPLSNICPGPRVDTADSLSLGHRNLNMKNTAMKIIDR